MTETERQALVAHYDRLAEIAASLAAIYTEASATLAAYNARVESIFAGAR